ncbi:transposase (fragment) [Xenorhabdus nematophila ATCC 19061]|uniref:Transposase n=1 Tax=Xenorhabdus nematophila (strain ATCC 19061 / DSM 3370 / CCUG 14189 / LMG 1036 / NCIMB 9965 / AN6) TaxID=406817 RepID=D3VEJ5_XENNA
MNPIERLWKLMNEEVRNNVYFPTPTAFRTAIHHFFAEILPQKASQIISRLADKFQILKPASSS